MPKVTSKLQVTVPKVIADQYGIAPGDEIDWVAAGDAIRVIPHRAVKAVAQRPSPLRVFDSATARHHARTNVAKTGSTRDRGWTREDLYSRGRAR